jgi:hypothetical protein
MQVDLTDLDDRISLGSLSDEMDNESLGPADPQDHQVDAFSRGAAASRGCGDTMGQLPMYITKRFHYQVRLEQRRKYNIYLNKCTRTRIQDASRPTTASGSATKPDVVVQNSYR